jgi:hypothetical protein
LHSFYNERHELDVAAALAYLRIVCRQIKEALLADYLEPRIRTAVAVLHTTESKLHVAIADYARRRRDLLPLAQKPLHLIDEYMHHRNNVATFQRLKQIQGWSYTLADYALERELSDEFPHGLTTDDEDDFIEELPLV